MNSLNHNTLGIISFTVTFIIILSIAFFTFAATVTLTPFKLGAARTYDNTVWNDARNDSTPNGTWTIWNGVEHRTDYGLSCNGASDYCLYRHFVTFDTGSTTLASATINSVKFGEKVATKTDNGASINLSKTNWSGTMVGADFIKLIDTATSPVMIATAKTIASITADSSTWNEWTLDATGLAYMNYGANGTTSFAMLLSADYTGTAPTLQDQIIGMNPEQVRLVIDYTPASVAVPFIDESSNWYRQLLNFVTFFKIFI